MIPRKGPGTGTGHAFLYIFIILALFGCKGYQPMPLAPEAGNGMLAPPDMEQVRIRADLVKHPILKPMGFDYGDGLGPDEAALMAVISNPGLRAARDRRGVARAQVLEAGILPNPKLSYGLETPVGGDTASTVNAFNAGLGWNITALISRGARLDAARAHASSVDLDIAWREWQAAEAAKMHLYGWLIGRKRVSLTARLEKLSGQFYQAVKRGAALGENTSLDLTEAGAGYGRVQLLAIQAQAGSERSRIELNRALGVPASMVIKTEDDIPIPYLRMEDSGGGLSAAALTKGLAERRLDLLALRLGYETQEANLRAAIRSGFPKITVSLTGARDTDNVRTLGGGVAIDIPLFDRNQGRVAVAKATRRQLFDEYTARLFEARAEVALICNSLSSVRKQLRDIDAVIPGARDEVKKYGNALREGNATLLNYYQAVKRLLSDELDRAGMEQKMVDLEIALEISTGRYLPFYREDKPEAPPKIHNDGLKTGDLK